MYYKEYLNSSLWRRRRHQVFYWRGKRCERCGKKATEIHHKTYERLFNEDKKKDLIPLCRKCHQEVHDFSKKNALTVFQATSFVVKKRPAHVWKKMTPLEREEYLAE